MIAISRHIVCVFLILFSALATFAQTENEIKNDANKLFENEQYVEATPLFLRLISLNPKSYEYNFKYGTCLLFNSNIKSEGLRYLNYAVKDENIDPRAYYFRGKALHLDYQFDNAKKSYQRYLKEAKSPDPRYDVDLEIKMCESGKRLLTQFTDIIVAEKKEIDKEQFFRIYSDAETLGGEVVVFEDFQSKIDKKKGHIPVAHFRYDAPAIYYASYGDNEDNGLDIYVRKRLPDNTWGLPQPVPGMVNTPEDENFPYLHPSGRFLYFSSKGHNSMGGYDIFMSRYAESTDSWMQPENVDFAISSPDDDLFYVVDSLYENAYFASARQSENGKYHVYRVKVVRVPIEEVIVMGEFESTVDPNITMTAKLVQVSNNKEVAETETNDKKKYAIVFPKGGTYNYMVKLSNSQDIRKFTVEIPHLEEIRPLKQKMIHTIEEGEEVVKIVNMFDEKVEGAEELIAQLIREKSKLDVNIDNFDMEKVEAEKTKKAILADLEMGGLTANEVSGQLKELKKLKLENEKQAEIIKVNMDRSIVEKSKQLKNLNDQQKDLENRANNASNPIEKHKLLSQAREKEWEKRAVSQQIANLNKMRDEVGEIMLSENVSTAQLDNISKEFDDLLATNDELSAIKSLKAHKDEIETIRNSSADKIVNNLLEKRIKLNSELDDLKAAETRMDQRVAELKAQNQVDQGKIPFAKKKDLAALESAVAKRNKEIEQLEREKELIQKDKKDLGSQIVSLDDQIDVLQRAKGVSTVPEAVSEEELRKALLTAQEYQSDEETTSYDSQIAQIETEHPELAGRTYVDETIASAPELGEIRKDASVKENQILNNNSLSKEEQLKELINNTQRTINDLESRLEYLEEKDGGTPSDEQEELRKYLNAQESKLQGYQDELELLADQPGNEVVSSEYLNEPMSEGQIQEDVMPGYEEKISQIDPKSNDSESLNEAVAVSNDFIERLEEHKQNIQKAIESNPDNENLKTNLDVVKELIASETKRRDEWQNQIDESATVVSNEKTYQTSEQVMKELAPQFESVLASIKDSDLSNFEKQTEQIDLYDQTIIALEEERRRLENLQNENPSTEIAQNIDLINEAISNLERDKNNISASTSNDTKITKEEVLTDIMPDFELRKQAVRDTEDDIMSQQAAISLEEDLIRAAEKEMLAVEKDLKKNPSDELAIEKQKALQELIDESQERKSEAEQTLNALLDVSSIPETAELDDEIMRVVDPGYETDIFSIRQQPGTELALIEQEVAREEELIKKLKDHEKQLNKDVKADPGNQQKQKELDKIKELISAHESRVNDLENLRDQIAVNNKSLSSSEDLIAQIDPNYFSEKERITNDNTLSPKERITSLQKNDIALLNAIEKREKELQSQLESDPGNKQVQKELEKIQDLKANIAEMIDLRDDEIKANGYETEQVDTNNDQRIAILEKAVPKYSATLDKINTSGLNREELLETRIEFNKEVMSALKDEERSLANFLEDNPGDREAEKELSIIKTLTNEIQKQLDSDREELQLERSKNDRLTSTQDDIKTIYPDYEDRADAIERNDGITREEQLQQLQELDLELVRKINEEQDRLTDEAVNASDDTAIREKIERLEELKGTIQQMIADREVELFNLTSAQPVVSAEEKSEVRNEIDPEYESEIASIEASSSNERRIAQLTDREEKHLDKLKEEQRRIEQEYRVDPSRIDLKKRLDVINALVKDSETRLRDLESMTVEASSPITERDKQAVQEEVLVNYEERKADIQNSDVSPETQREELLALENELLDNLISERQTVQDELRRKGDSAELNKRKEILDQLIEETQSRIEQLENSYTAQVNTNQKYSEEEQTLLNELDKNYLNNQTASLPNSQDELEVKFSSNAEMLERLNNELARIEKKLDKTPGDAELLARKETVQKLIDKIESEQQVVLERMSENPNSSTKVADIVKRTDATYEADIASIKSEGGPMEANAIAERERIHQDKLNERIAELEQKQKRKYSVDVELELVRMKQMVEASKEREEQARIDAQTSPEERAEQEQFIASMRGDKLPSNEDVVSREETTLEGLKEQEAALEQYEKKLEAELDAIESKDISDEEKDKQRSWVEAEIEEVQKKRRKVSFDIGEMTTVVLNDDGQEKEDVNSQVKSSTPSDTELMKLVEEEDNLKEQLNNPELSSRDKKAIETEIEQVQEKKTSREVVLSEDRLIEETKRSKQLESEYESVASTNPESEKMKEYVTAEKSSIDNLKEEAFYAKSDDEKKYLLEQANQRQEELNDDLEEAVIDAKKSSVEEEFGISIDSEEEMERKQRSFSIEIGEIERRIVEIDEELKTAKKKDRPGLEEEKKSLVAEKESISAQLERIIAQMRAENEKKAAAVVEEEARETPVTFNEERKIASSQEYQDYQEKADRALQIEEDITNLETELKADQREMKILLQTKDANDPEVGSLATEIKTKQDDISAKQSELETAKRDADLALPADEEQAMKMKNLASRGIKPIQTAVVVASMVNMPTTSLAIKSDAESIYSEANPIPISVEAPKGLVYRVQIGAFRNKIPQDLFSEFNPVSGEPIGTTGITRYMAGYFGSSDKVVKAREEIRNLGYADAYVVAYCDGKRIGFGEAKQLEASGTCVPKKEEEIMFEVAVNTAENMGITTETVLEEVSEYSYAQAPGAVESTPIELTKGLFFTVQVGVFSKPVTKHDLLELDDIYTVRMDNGKIRYNSGMFDSVEEAKARKELANSRGLKGFVTAYFEGERISIEEAEELLAQYGSSILQSNIEKSGDVPVVKKLNAVGVDSIKPRTEEEIKYEENNFVQIVTKESFTEFPRDILNRYNAKGEFYFDENDGKVKSVVYDNPDKLPWVYKFRFDIDTVYLAPEDLISEHPTISVILNQGPLPGDFVDWLFRFNYRREFTRLNEGQQLKIFGVEPEKQEAVLEKIRSFGLEPELIKELEEIE